MANDEYPVLNIESAKQELSLDGATIIELARDFSETRETFLSPIRNGIESSDIETVREYAHRLKGAAYNLRIDRIGDHAFELEQAAADGDLASSAGILQRVETLFVSLQDELDRPEKGPGEQARKGGE